MGVVGEPSGDPATANMNWISEEKYNRLKEKARREEEPMAKKKKKKDKKKKKNKKKKRK